MLFVRNVSNSHRRDVDHNDELISNVIEMQSEGNYVIDVQSGRQSHFSTMSCSAKVVRASI